MASSSTFNANDPTASGMVLTFDDEFDSNDTSNNGVASGTQWANHIWYDSADPGAVSVSNGVLSLAAGGSLSTTNTAGQGFSQEYGYFEIDMKLPSTNGSWPAFWLESLAHALDPNAPSSEIDVIEGQGVYPDGYWATLHYNSSSQGPAGADQQNADNFTGDLGTNLSAGFNRYGVLWSPTSNDITFYFNGNPILTVPDYSTTNSSAMMVLIDNWVGNMGGGVDNNGSGGGALEVDYVRVYQFASQDPTAVVAQAVSPAAGQTDPTALANADGVTPGGSTSGSGTSDPPPPTPSANDTVVTGTSGDIVTAALNTFAINSSGQITENGTALSDTASVTELAYVGGTLYQENAAGDWWSFNETTSTWTAVSDPLTTTSGSTGSTSASDPPPPTPSANDTVVTGTSGDIVTAALNTFAINSSGEITENGTALSDTASVTELAYIGGTLYQENAAGDWWSFNETTSAWTSVSDPLTTTSGSASTGSSTGTSDPPPPTPSANDTVVTGTSGDIVTAAHNTFAINASGEITENGTALSDTASVTELAYVGGTLYQENAAHDWWSFNETTSAWTAVSDPLTTTSGSGSASTGSTGTSDPPPPTPSANDTVVTGTSGDIVTAAHNTFAINASGEITENGTALSDTASVTELAYVGGTLYQENAAHDWWSFNETTSAWTSTSDPLPTPSANDTVVVGTKGDIVTAAYNTFAINNNGYITENGAVMADTSAVNELAYVGGTLYQEATTKDLWWSYNETTNAWTSTSDPLPTPSTNDTVVTGTSGDIVTAAHNTFAINSSGEITENGTALSDTASVSELAYVGGTLYQENAAHDWWSFNETTSAWTSTSDPLPTPSANDTVVVGTKGDIVTAAYNTFAINNNGYITENGAVMADTGAANELAYVGGTLYQEATTKDLWWSYNETTNAWTSTSDPLPQAMAPNLTVYEAAGSEHSAIPVYISAAQDSSTLAASNLTVTVSGLDGATLSAGTESNGVYTLSAAQLSGLTVTPAAGFTGTLALHVQATDTELGLNNHASSATDTLDVSVTAPSTSETMLSPSFTDGTHSVYMLSWPPESDAHIANFDPSTDLLDLAPLLSEMGVKSTDPIGQHIVDFEATSNGGTAVVIDPSGDNPSHGTTVVTLDHVLPQSIPAADIWT